MPDEKALDKAGYIRKVKDALLEGNFERAGSLQKEGQLGSSEINSISSTTRL